jgi:hypothetical protein
MALAARRLRATMARTLWPTCPTLDWYGRINQNQRSWGRLGQDVALHRQGREPRKRRTREHVVADLSVNHVERIVIEAGHTVQRQEHDYGYDLSVITYDAEGYVEPGLFSPSEAIATVSTSMFGTIAFGSRNSFR